MLISGGSKLPINSSSRELMLSSDLPRKLYLCPHPRPQQRKQRALSVKPVLRWGSPPRDRNWKWTRVQTNVLFWHCTTTFDTNHLRSDYPLLLYIWASGIWKVDVYRTPTLCLVSVQMKAIWWEKRLLNKPMTYKMTYQQWVIEQVIEQLEVRGRCCLSQAVGLYLFEEIIFVLAFLSVGERTPPGSPWYSQKSNMDVTVGLRHYWNMLGMTIFQEVSKYSFWGEGNRKAIRSLWW